MRGVPAGVLLLPAAPVAAPLSHAADPGVQNLPWPNLMPPVKVSSAVQPHPRATGRVPSITGVDQLARRLEAQRAKLDATGDHRVVPARSYLRMTQALRDVIA